MIIIYETRFYNNDAIVMIQLELLLNIISYKVNR